MMMLSSRKELIDKGWEKILDFFRSRSMWMLHYCTGCGAVELPPTMTARWDMERFGIGPMATPRQADLLLITGYLSVKSLKRVIYTYEQMQDPKWVIAFGSCPINGGIYFDSYTVINRLSLYIPVDLAIEGCMPRPEAIIHGFNRGRSTKIPGTESPRVIQALNFLEKVREYVRGNIPLEEVPLAEKMFVIGGGNVAFDVSRSLVRLQRIKFGKADVQQASLETLDILPADREEYEEAVEEGVKFYPGWGPKEIVLDENGMPTSIKLVKCTRVFDENHRFAPQFDESQTMEVETQMVIEAIGQMPDYSYIPEEIQNQLEFERGRIKCGEYGETSLGWLFVAEDIKHGPDIVHAIADGHNAAIGIDKYFSEQEEK